MKVKAFISYSTKDKKYGTAVKATLDKIGKAAPDKINLESFLAHDDVRVSEEWKKRILAELKECKIFVPLLSEAFKGSDWCGQETGFVVERGNVLIIPLSIDGTVPYGFISHLQCHQVSPDGIDPQPILGAIGRKWPSIVIEVLLKSVEGASSFRRAEELIEPLVPYFERLAKQQASRLAHMAIDNGQIWAAHLCREKYLPLFLKLNRTKISPSQYRALKYQIENQRWYEGAQS
jgi:hypothetical protein